MNTYSPALHIALDYCARKLLAELERPPAARVEAVLANRLTSTSAALLRWWCSTGICRTRVDNFHTGQRQAILHTVLAHELLQTDDPEWLYRLACDPAQTCVDPSFGLASPARYAGYVVRMTPGTGLRWVAQALLVWQWANHVAARASGRDDPRFSGDFTLFAANDAVRLRLQDGVLGPIDDCGQRDVMRSSLVRHAPLFLPPSLRAPLCDWLQTQAPSPGDDSALHIVDTASGLSAGATAITLAAGAGVRMLGGGRRARTVENRLSDDHGPPGHMALLWIDLALMQTPTTPSIGTMPIVEFPLDRAIRNAAAKLPMLEPTQHLHLRPLRAASPRSMGLRPRLSRAHRSLLDIGLDALSRRDDGFVALDPARRPKLLVLCDTPQIIRNVRHTLIASGMDKQSLSARVVIETLPARTTLTDAHICVIVVLRTGIAKQTPAELLAPALPPLWPEPDFAALRGENRERAALGRAPSHLLDVLSVVEHPQCHAEYAELLRAGLAARGDEDRETNATGDVIVADLRADAADFEIAMPCIYDDRAVAQDERSADRLSELPRRFLRARQSMPVHKSVYTHAGWGTHDAEMRRAFVECAEADPCVESHCLLDPRRHTMRSRDALLAQGIPPSGLPEALVRTADAVYLVEFLSSCPAQPQPPSPCERALARWCARTNARLPEQRQYRCWHRVQLQAPLFWSWKRSGGTLAALLAALAGTAPLARRGREAAAAH